MPSHEHIIEESESGLEIKTIVRAVMGVSATRFSRMKFNQGVLLDGQIARAGDKVHTGQVLTLIEMEKPSYTPHMADINVPIVYEDEHLYVVNKPAPMASQSGARQKTDTLENAMAFHFRAEKDYIFRPVNRLDKGTSGLMVVAKSGLVHALMQKKLQANQFLRSYMAITQGAPKQPLGKIELPIARAAESILRREVSQGGCYALTYYHVVHEHAGHALVHLVLMTGRTHQIRVHLSFMGCPVVGDFLYGKEIPELPGRFALHAHEITFAHPITGRRISLKADMPQELQRLL